MKSTRFISRFENRALANYLEKHPEVWKRTDPKHRAYREFGATQSLFLLYDERGPDCFIPKFHPENRDLFELALPALDFIADRLGPGYWARAVLGNLPPAAQIDLHIDPGWPFSVQRRFHWVIKTNPDVQIQVGHKRYHFAQDEIWEFNNKRPHGVFNRGSHERIHLVADYVVAADAWALHSRPYPKDSTEYKLFASGTNL